MVMLLEFLQNHKSPFLKGVSKKSYSDLAASESYKKKNILKVNHCDCDNMAESNCKIHKCNPCHTLHPLTAQLT